MTRWYVSGPMRGYEKFNFPAFDSLSAQLTEDGHEVVNPAQHDRDVYPKIETWPGFASGDVDACPEFDLHEALSWDLAQVAACDEIAFLPGWEESSGATHERYVAEVCNKMIWLAHREYASWGEYWSLYFDDEQRRVSEPHDPEFRQLLREEAEIEARFREAEAQGNAKRVFDTGASRDAAEHKPDWEGFLSPAVILEFGRYMHKNRQMADGSLRDSDNWQKGIPLDAYMKSLLRHVIQLWALHRGHDVVDYDGETPIDPKDALCGVLFNAQGYLHEVLKGERENEQARGRLFTHRVTVPLSRRDLERVDV